MKKAKNNYKNLLGKLKGEEIIWRLGNNWEDNIKIDLKTGVPIIRV